MDCDQLGDVLDVGSGVGKFCAIGALSTHGLFTGIEGCGGSVSLSWRRLSQRRRRSCPQSR